MESIPLVLVHGWKSHPGIWRRLIEQVRIPSEQIWLFDYSGLYESTISQIAHQLRSFLHEKRRVAGYHGPVDIVCHSMGGYVTRYYVEVLDGKKREEKVRQLIEIGVPNQGSSMAEIFNDPVHGPEVIDVLSGEFVPQKYEPEKDVNVQGLRIRSRETRELCNAGIRPDIRYRNILAANRTGDPTFFPSFNGRTWVLGHDETWRTTWLGDGVIPHYDSYLPGTEFDLVPADPVSLQADPYQYCHIFLPKNPEVIRLIIRYITNPAAPSSERFPDHR
jgi:hypothetical protein